MLSKIAILYCCITIANCFLVPTSYNFGYDIKGPLDSHSREESRDANGDVVGSYSIKDADGRSRRVTYTAGAGGFNAKIESNEQGVLSKSSANVEVNGAQLPVKSSFQAPLGADFSAGESLVPVAYKFGYDIEGASDSQSREESGENGRVVGSYSLKDSDGRSRRVDYTADENGFRAKIDTNEHGTAAKSPADVILNSPHPAPVEPLPVAPLELPAAPFSVETHLPLSQISVSAPLELPTKSAPFSTKGGDYGRYTSYVHSKTEYAKAPEQAPVVQEFKQAPLVQEIKQELVARPLEFSTKSAPLPIKRSYGNYKSYVHSKIDYAKAPEQAPIMQEFKQDELVNAAKAPVIRKIREAQQKQESALLEQQPDKSTLQVKDFPPAMSRFSRSKTLPKLANDAPQEIKLASIQSSQTKKLTTLQEMKDVSDMQGIRQIKSSSTQMFKESPTVQSKRITSPAASSSIYKTRSFSNTQNTKMQVKSSVQQSDHSTKPLKSLSSPLEKTRPIFSTTSSKPVKSLQLYHQPPRKSILAAPKKLIRLSSLRISQTSQPKSVSHNKVKTMKLTNNFENAATSPRFQIRQRILSQRQLSHPLSSKPK